MHGCGILKRHFAASHRLLFCSCLILSRAWMCRFTFEDHRNPLFVCIGGSESRADGDDAAKLDVIVASERGLRLLHISRDGSPDSGSVTPVSTSSQSNYRGSPVLLRAGSPVGRYRVTHSSDLATPNLQPPVLALSRAASHIIGCDSHSIFAFSYVFGSWARLHLAHDAAVAMPEVDGIVSTVACFALSDLTEPGRTLLLSQAGILSDTETYDNVIVTCSPSKLVHAHLCSLECDDDSVDAITVQLAALSFEPTGLVVDPKLALLFLSHAASSSVHCIDLCRLLPSGLFKVRYQRYFVE